MLARLHRAGELTGVWVPDAAHEAMRDLVRARATAMKVLSKARQHLGGFLLRHGKIYSGVRTWTQAYRRWLTMVRFDHPARQIVLQDYIDAVTDAERRVDRLTLQITEHLPSWSMAPVATAIQAMRGVALIDAVTIVAEVGDFSRFGNPRQLMAYLGLVPSEHFEWRHRAQRWDHKGRQSPRPTRPDRGSLDLPYAGTRQSKAVRSA
jgi:transposase